MILVSPFGIIPLYASTNLGLAFAQEINNQTLSESMSDVLVNITNSTDTLPTNSTDTLPTNSTDTLPTNSTDFEIIIPEASLSFQFDDLSSLSNNDTSSKSESAPLNLNGQDDFIQIENVTVTNDLNGLTITAWVNPDYSSGSPEFTVLSKKNLSHLQSPTIFILKKLLNSLYLMV